MKLTQKNFDSLVNTLNHKVTKLQVEVNWIKRIGYYMAIILTAQLGFNII